MKCANDPDVETELRCGRCGVPICPRCMIMTPGGQRCRTCARLRRPPMYEVGPLMLARAAGAAIVVGVAGGVVWRLLPGFLGLFLLLFAVGFGYVMAEAVGRVTNRKRGYPLQVIAAFGVVLAYLVRNYLAFGALIIPTLDIFGWIALAIAIVMAINPLR